MSWTLQKPTKAGWYWYRKPGFNMNKPLPVWVYDVLQPRHGADAKIFYAHLMPPHDKGPLTERVEECKGEWAGTDCPAGCL
jgi:hypothetical protein